MTLFTEAQLIAGQRDDSHRRVHSISDPGARELELAVNKNVTAGATYDEKQDVAKAPMETVQVDQASDALEVAFAHVGARCTLRIYIGKTASFAEFTAK